MKSSLGVILAVTIALLSLAAAAADPRVRATRYSEYGVYSLTGRLGFQTAIEFNADETIENVAIGDSLAWQVTPNRRGDVLIVKPVSAAPPTNMTVVTNLRRYLFALEIADEGDAAAATFLLRFVYPTKEAPQTDVAPPAAEPDSGPVNTNYSYEGARELIPSKLFDDGRSTYFKWPERTSTPAIFLVGPEGGESIVNHGYSGEYIVIDRVARAFLLRLGEREATIFNDGWTPVDPGPDAPRERLRERGFFGRVFGGGEGR